MPLPLLASALLLSGTPERIPLEGAWRLTQAERKIAIPATVPGVVQTALMNAGKIPDPFFGTNEKIVQWVGELPWTYSREFKVPSSFLKHRKIVLQADGLDTLATLTVNGKEVAHPDNPYRTWEFDMRPYLKAGANTIRLDFAPIEPFLKAHEVQAKFPGKPVQSHGWGYVRKPSFQMGWDFSPKLITAGIWHRIGLIGWDTARLNDIAIAQDHRAKGRVGLDVKIAADTEGPTQANVSILFKGKPVAQSKTRLSHGAAEAKLTVTHPELWWPNGMGPQNLYDVRVELLNAKGQLVDRGNRRIGLRTVNWFDKTDHSPLSLAVNGRRFFAKGSNWVPADSLLRTTPAQERSLVQKAVDAHMNLIRLWGGGHYESDSFFDACDEKGLLTWFEFKFADATYPAFDPDWLANVRAEAQDNVRRVRHHPSVAVYSGNNEVIGFIVDKTVPSGISRDDYNLLFHTTLRDVVKDLAPGAFYTPGSPEIGDDHYWDVWHGSATFASYRDRHGFMSEYGFQAFPVPRTVESFTTSADRSSVETKAMLNHQKNWRDGNALMVSTFERSFRKAKDFDSTLWLSQIQQSDGILTGVEHWRRDWPHSSGSLVWQFNDPWPGMSWSMVDYYGRPKALYYGLKHAYAPVALSGLTDPDKGTAKLWVANDRPFELRGRVEWTITKVDGTVLTKGMRPVSIPPGTSQTEAGTLDLAKLVKANGAENILIWARLKTNREPDSTTLLRFAKPKMLPLSDPHLKTLVSEAPGGFKVTLSAARPALWTWIELKGMDADLSDNFIHLRAGEPATILVKPAAKTSLSAIRQSLRVRSLYDTYRPGTEPNPVTRPDGAGRLVATADNAEVVGDAAILEVGTPSNIGNWAKVEDGLSWAVQDAKAGIYNVTATVSIPHEEAGSTFDVIVAGRRVSGTVPGTGSWTTYRTIDLGTLLIDKAGPLKIELKPTKLVRGHVMNLRSVTFTPAPNP